MPLASFCVEAGRWTARGGQASGTISSSNALLATNGQKVAARAQVSQQEVWRNVTKLQTEIASNAMTEVRDRRSATSLQLTLENAKLNEVIAASVKDLSGAVDKTADAIGCAVVINGKVIGADTYASAGLFKKLWPKLLKAAAVEAVAERNKDAQFSMPTEDAVRKFLADGDRGKAKETAVSKRINQLHKVGANTLLFECHDNANAGAALRAELSHQDGPARRPSNEVDLPTTCGLPNDR